MPGVGNKRGTEHSALKKFRLTERNRHISKSKQWCLNGFERDKRLHQRLRQGKFQSVLLGRTRQGPGRWCRSLRSPFWETNFYRPDCKGPASTLKLQPCFTWNLRQRKCGLQSFKVSAWTEHCADWLITLQNPEHLIKKQYISVKIMYIFFPSSNTENYGMNPSSLAY